MKKSELIRLYADILLNEPLYIDFFAELMSSVKLSQEEIMQKIINCVQGIRSDNVIYSDEGLIVSKYLPDFKYLSLSRTDRLILDLKDFSRIETPFSNPEMIINCESLSNSLVISNNELKSLDLFGLNDSDFVISSSNKVDHLGFFDSNITINNLDVNLENIDELVLFNSTLELLDSDELNNLKKFVCYVSTEGMFYEEFLELTASNELFVGIYICKTDDSYFIQIANDNESLSISVESFERFLNNYISFSSASRIFNIHDFIKKIKAL